MHQEVLTGIGGCGPEQLHFIIHEGDVQMAIRFYNAQILTMEDGPVVFGGEVVVSEDKISYVGEKAPAGIYEKEIDCGQNLLMPGFKDAHTHSAMTFLRSSADDLPLQSWLNEQVFPYEAKLTGEDIYHLSKLAILEYLTSGITAVMEMYLTPPTIAEAFRDAGFRIVQVGACNNFSQTPELIDEWYRTLNEPVREGSTPLTSFELGFHAEYTCSEELIEKFAALAHQYKAPVFTHISETKSEVEACIGRYGKTPVAFLADKGIFDYGGAGYHLVHTTPDDYEIMKEKKIGVVTNPASNTKLASGIAPLSDYLREGIPVAIGTDGPASNNCLDMFREMFLATGLGKLRESDASAVPAFEVLKMATVNGAGIMRQPLTAYLKEGYTADMIMLDLHQPNMQPINHIPNNIVYSGSKLNVLMTMVGGRILYDRFDGKLNFHIDTDPEEIYRVSGEIKDRIFH